jgi:hypothetical protein
MNENVHSPAPYQLHAWRKRKREIERRERLIVIGTRVLPQQSEASHLCGCESPEVAIDVPRCRSRFLGRVSRSDKCETEKTI